MIKEQTIKLDDKEDFRKLARGYACQAMHMLADIVSDVEASPAARVSAAKLIIERAYGSVLQEVPEHNEAEGEQLQFMFEVDD